MINWTSQIASTAYGLGHARLYPPNQVTWGRHVWPCEPAGTCHPAPGSSQQAQVRPRNAREIWSARFI